MLAAGAIETPRLWFNNGLPDPNGWVGRGLTEHYPDLVGGVMPFETGSSKGRAPLRVLTSRAGAASRTQGPPLATSAFSGAFSDSGIAGFYDNGSPVGPGGADAVGRIVGPRLKALLADVDRLHFAVVVTDDDVESQHRVTLSSALPPDEHGAVPRVEVQHRNRSARTAANREFLVRKAVELVRAAGALSVFRLNWPPYLIHIHSTMRIGASAGDSVLDAGAEARSVKRLFIADNSALPNGVGGVNPTLTTQALATRTAERIFQRYFGGDPWVSGTAPVSSIDPSVTAGRRRPGSLASPGV